MGAAQQDRIAVDAPDIWPEHPTGPQLAALLTDARRRSLELLSDLTAEQLRVPLLGVINPPVWEFGHVAWFQEKWTLRHLRGAAPILEHADALYDSAGVAHDTRWDLPLPSIEQTLDYASAVLDRVVDGLDGGEPGEDTQYFCWLAVMHEDMHGEALAYTRQTLGYAPPSAAPANPHTVEPVSGDVEIPGGEFDLGAPVGARFVFDNEKWAHRVRVAPFGIARTPVTYGQFADFVDDGGYRRRDLWSEEGLAWLDREQAAQPVYWIAGTGGWHHRRWDRVEPISRGVSMIHVNWHEAEAWCRWAGRRLPTEAEWELAAAGSGKRVYPWGNEPPGPHRARLDGTGAAPATTKDCGAGDTPEGVRQLAGSVWEWTSSSFLPYPGFVLDPYQEYSLPWFTPAYKVLRGGCWATRSRLIRNTWRNFYTKDRRDVLAGFRTCAL